MDGKRSALPDRAAGVLESVDRVRREVTKTFEQATREQLGQFFTPARVADFMASLFEPPKKSGIVLLDPGAGVGS